MKPVIWVNIGKKADLMINKRKNPLVGIIAEDDSDVDSIKTLIHRISGNDLIGTKHFVGKGCGKINRKSNLWASNLKEKGCSLLILVHDLDNNDLKELEKKILSAIKPCPFDKYLICIPIQELEAWLLSDPDAIKSVFNLKKTPKITGFPYDINNPKEFLRNIIKKTSNNEIIYLNTKHNSKISQAISIDKVKEKNPSFITFYKFVVDNMK